MLADYGATEAERTEALARLKDAKQDATLVLTDFTGKQLPAHGSADAAAGNGSGGRLRARRPHRGVRRGR